MHSKVKARTGNTDVCSCDLELDPMTLIYEHDLDIMQYGHWKHETGKRGLELQGWKCRNGFFDGKL